MDRPNPVSHIVLGDDELSTELVDGYGGTSPVLKIRLWSDGGSDVVLLNAEHCRRIATDLIARADVIDSTDAVDGS